ncbi:MAG: peptidoglycan-associated lipoprotein [Rhodocyclales bacterium GT-UBC]|nr:MAG: peptidoglycan-associated lipoprotein [Rhodocyclales bacterium GT-UBC]
MRPTLPATLLLSALLAACVSTKDVPVNKNISQNSQLKVHPGLVGQAIPAELQTDMRPSQPNVAPDLGATTGSTRTPSRPAEPGAQPAARSIYFDFDSASLKGEFEPVLQAHARYLASHPKAKIRVEGSADERGSPEYNRQLGLKRAETVRQKLIAQGAQEKQVSARTLGEARPKQAGHDEQSWAENRRADLVYEAEH